MKGPRKEREGEREKKKSLALKGIATAKARLSDGIIGFLGRQSMVAPIGNNIGAPFAHMQVADPNSLTAWS